MCELCMKTPCHPRCPNATEPKPLYRCSVCGYGIYEGDNYFNSEKGAVCGDCLYEMSANEYLEYIGEATSVA